MAKLEGAGVIAYNRTSNANLTERRGIVSFDLLLYQLVSAVDGAAGAIIVAGDGEGVQWFPASQSERLRLVGAYVGLIIRDYRTAASRAGLESLKQLVLEYNGATLVSLEIDEDCFVMLELEPRGNLGQALYQLQTAAGRIRDEIAV